MKADAKVGTAEEMRTGCERPGAADERRVDQRAAVIVDAVDDEVNELLRHISHSKWICASDDSGTASCHSFYL